MRRNYMISLLTAVSMAALLSAGCSSKGTQADTAGGSVPLSETQRQASYEEGKQITLSLMNHTSEEARVAWEDAVIEAFEQENPNITVEVQRMSYDNYIQTLQTKFASGDAPDIFALENTYIEKYIQNGYVRALDGLKAADRFQEGALDMLTADGSVYAIPYNSKVMCVTYNKAVFEEVGITEVPATLDEFYDVCKKIQAAGITPIGGAYSDTWCLMADIQADYIPGVLLDDKTAILDVQERTRKFADSEAWRGVLTRMQERLQYVNDDPFGTDWDSVCTMLANGDVAMTLNGFWTSNNVSAMNPDARMGIFALPTTNDSSKNLLAIQSPTEGLAIHAECKKMEAAEAFLDYWTSPESASLFLEYCNEVLVLKDVEVPNKDGVTAEVIEMINDGRAVSLGMVDHNFTNEYRDALQTVVAEFLIQGMSVDDALAALDAEFDRIAGQ